QEKLKGHINWTEGAIHMPEGERMITLSGSYDGTARQWDVESGEIILTPIKTGYEWVLALIYLPDMTCSASTSGSSQRSWNRDKKHQVEIWDARTGE
ncbi:hypothetical protein BDR06DRAFT_838808, partial [Suillus hirtellus]